MLKTAWEAIQQKNSCHMDRLRYKPKKTLQKEGLIDVSAELLQHFIAQVENHVYYEYYSLSRHKQFMFQALRKRYRRSSKC
jgi:hypothetical protein